MGSRRTRARRIPGLRARAWLTLGALALGGAGLTGVASASPADHGKPAATARGAAFHTIRLSADGPGHKGVDKRGTKTFSMLGISWPKAGAGLDGRAQVRTRSIETGRWTDWQDLETDHHSPDGAEKQDPSLRGGTTPLWVGPSDGVEARVVADDGSATTGLPEGLRLDLVDPGVTKQEAGQANGAPPAAPAPSDAPGPAPAADAPSAPPSTVHRPPVITRAEWGADESMVEDPPTYNEDGVQIAFVHHTAETNNYSCTQSAAIMRAMMDFHINSRGYNDLGYNFVVDKCGRIFEGRAGGIDLPVHGAHTLGFNSYSTGIAVMGRFDNYPGGYPNQRIDRAVARIAAYKLGQYGVDPTGEVTLTALDDTGVYDKGEQATLKTVSGHRDGFNTACPGDDLYAQLPEIRRYAASPASSSAQPTADADRDGTTDFAAGMPAADRGGADGAGMVSVVPGGGAGPVPAARISLDQDSPGVPGGPEDGDAFGADSAYGDVDGDGFADLVVGVPGEESGAGTDAGGVVLLHGPDLDNGTALLAPDADQTDDARLGAGLTVADFDSDGYADVLAVSPGKPGTWWLFDGASLQPVQHGLLGGSAYGAGSDDVDVTAGDYDGDGYRDAAVTFRDPQGSAHVLVLRGSADGLVRQGLLGTPGGHAVDSGDTDGDGYADLVVGQPSPAASGARTGGQVTVLPGSPDGLDVAGKQILHPDTAGVPGGSESGDAFGWSVALGDTNNDRYADLLVGVPGEDIGDAGDTGMVNLLFGSASGLTGAGSAGYHQDTPGIPGGAETGDRFGSSVLLSDLSGWARTDLLIGDAGENGGDGSSVMIPAGSAGIDPAQSTYYDRSVLGTPPGAGLGSTLTP